MENKGSVNECSQIPEHRYLVEAKIQFDVRASSFTAAYKELVAYLGKLFNEGYANGNEKPIIVPSQYDTRSITKVD
jgi:hypothetical protein